MMRHLSLTYVPLFYSVDNLNYLFQPVLLFAGMDTFLGPSILHLVAAICCIDCEIGSVLTCLETDARLFSPISCHSAAHRLMLVKDGFTMMRQTFIACKHS